MVRFPVEVRDLPILHNIETGSGAHLASYPVDTRSYISEVEWAGT
jgi:hypothetical protein